MSPIEEHASFAIEGTDYELISLVGDEALSRHFRYEVLVVASASGVNPASLLRRRATITLRDKYSGQRCVQGIVAEARTDMSPDGFATLRVTVRPADFRLTLGRDCRVFHDSSAVDIIQRVLDRGQVPARWELASTYASRVYTAQYRESDWNFIARLCEEEGIYFWFDHEGGDSILVFGDHSSSADDLWGGPRIRYVDSAGLTAAEETVSDLGPAVQVTPSRVALSAFDPTRPRFKPQASQGTGPFEVYEAPGGVPVDPDVVATRAAVLHEAAVAARSQVRGITTSVRLVPGRALEVVGHHVSQFDKRFIVTSVSIRIVQRRWGSSIASGSLSKDELSEQDRPLDIRFQALDSNVPFRPPHVTPRAFQAGLQSGVVVGPAGAEVYPDDAGRVRVQFHWDREGGRDEASGKWMRVAQRGTAGSMLLPRIGWNVLTTNEEGSPDAPMVMNRIVDSEHPPPYALPENMTRTTFKTATTPGGGSFNEIRYEDKAGAEEMFVNASRDMNVLVQNAKTEAIQSNALRKVGVDHALDVGNNSTESVGENQTIVIGGNEIETVGGSRVKSIGKDEAGVIGGSRSLKVGGANEAAITATRTLSVGAAQIDVSLGDIKANAPMVKVLVGGVVLKLSPRNIEEHVGGTVSASMVGNMIGGVAAQAASYISFSVDVGGVIQTIGGAKVELAGKSRTIVATKSYKEVVGGLMSLRAGGVFTDEAEGESTIAVGGALNAKGDNMVFTAGSKIELVCGTSKLSITDDRVLIHATDLSLDGASIVADAPKIEFNV